MPKSKASNVWSAVHHRRDMSVHDPFDRRRYLWTIQTACARLLIKSFFHWISQKFSFDDKVGILHAFNSLMISTNCKMNVASKNCNKWWTPLKLIKNFHVLNSRSFRVIEWNCKSLYLPVSSFRVWFIRIRICPRTSDSCLRSSLIAA